MARQPSLPQAAARTGLSGVPSTFAILLNRSNLAEREFAHLRYVTQAGGAMSPELTRRLMAAFPKKQIFTMYGATEASARLFFLSPADLPRKVGSIGKAIANVELRVLRPDGTEANVGEQGEIVVRGSNLMSGYWGDPQGTAEVLDEACGGAAACEPGLRTTGGLSRCCRSRSTPPSVGNGQPRSGRLEPVSKHPRGGARRLSAARVARTVMLTVPRSCDDGSGTAT